MSKYVLNEKGVALLCDPLRDNQIPKKKRKKHKVGRVFLIAALVIAALFAAVAVINFVHRKNMEKYIDRYGKVLYENQLMPEKDERGNACFTTDGDFKVMQLTDLHLGGGVLFADGERNVVAAFHHNTLQHGLTADLAALFGNITSFFIAHYCCLS